MRDCNPEIKLQEFTYLPTLNTILSLFEDTGDTLTIRIYQRTKCSGIRFYLNDFN